MSPYREDDREPPALTKTPRRWSDLGWYALQVSFWVGVGVLLNIAMMKPRPAAPCRDSAAYLAHGGFGSGEICPPGAVGEIKDDFLVCRCPRSPAPSTLPLPKAPTSKPAPPILDSDALEMKKTMGYVFSVDAIGPGYDDCDKDHVCVDGHPLPCRCPKFPDAGNFFTCARCGDGRY